MFPSPLPLLFSTASNGTPEKQSAEIRIFSAACVGSADYCEQALQPTAWQEVALEKFTELTPSIVYKGWKSNKISLFLSLSQLGDC